VLERHPDTEEVSHGRGPAVVLLHGVSESAAIWALLFPELRGFRLLAVDLPGHGLSDPVAFRRGQAPPEQSRLPSIPTSRRSCSAKPST
jgi:pimeloyl-ACP methyl ester carboxylesterase